MRRKEILTIHLDKTSNNTISVEIDDHVLEQTHVLEDCYENIKNALNAAFLYINKK